MTNEEIFEKIKQYESKWGKLGHTNIMNPEKNTIYHSGTNKDISQGGNKTMSRMDNELYKFRQKVAAGKEANKLAHKSYISPDELNKMNYDQLMNSHTLIHAANPMKGQQRENVKYYRREGQPGNYTYYYTKEEYDAAHGNGNAADANREAKARSAYETNKKIENYKNKQNVTNTSSNTRENNSQADFTKKFSDIARQSPEAAAKEIINDENTKIKTFYNKIDDGFRKGVIVWKNGRFEKGEDASDSDYENIKDEIESYSDQLEKFVKDVDTAAGSGKKTKDAIAKMMTNEIESMYQKAEKGKENLKANQNSREAAIKKSQINTVIDNLGTLMGKLETEYHKAFDKGDSEAGKKGWDKYFEERNKFMEEHGIEFGSPEYQEACKIADKMWEEYQKSIDPVRKGSKEYQEELKANSAKHSAISNSYLGDEIMDEYSAFQEKVKRGREMNRIAHSTFISPNDLNARYEKDLEKEGILVHAGNYKYYNKIDMPNGTTRYFYTKAEWDAYQDGQGQTKKQEQEKIVKKNADAAAHEGDRYIDKEKERKKMYQDLSDQARKHNEELAQKEKNEKQNAFNRERGAELARIKKYANAINNGDPSYPIRDVYYAIMDDHEKEIKQFESDVTFGSRNEKYEPSYDPYEDFTLDEMNNVGVLNPDKKPKYKYDDTGKAIIPEIKFNDKKLEQEYNDLLNKLLEDAKNAKKAAGYTKDDKNLEDMIKYYLDRELFSSWLDWYHPETGTQRYWDLKEKEINDIIKKQDKNAVSVETETYVDGKKVNTKKDNN